MAALGVWRRLICVAKRGSSRSSVIETIAA
jgi:hypothetical protein